MENTAPPKPTFREALAFWLKLGFISFGGPAGQIAIMHEFLVDKKRWLSDSKFLHALNYCMLLPGPEAQQLATYIGWLLHGTRGGLAAGIFFVLPSMLILWILSFLYVKFGQIPAVAALFWGLKPAVVAIVFLALVKIGKKSLHSFFHFSLAAAAFVAIFFFKISFPVVIFGTILIGLALWKFVPTFLEKKQTAAAAKKSDDDENQFFINKNTIVPGSGFSGKRLFGQISIAALLWFLPLFAFSEWSSDADFWQKLCLFFTRAALVTFGGAYAVLPYVAQVAVEKFHWLTAFQMVDGLALGETTPGPLIMVLAFVGFMAGWNQYGGSIFAATIGLTATTFYTFLPSFLFILAGAPLIERTQTNGGLKNLLALVTCAVVGVILNLAVYLFQAVIFQGKNVPDFWAFAWVLVSLVALYRFKINMIWWILVSAVFGLVLSFLK